MNGPGGELSTSPQRKQAAGGGYLYEHVTRRVLSRDFSFSADAPRAGDPLPSFDLPQADGGRLRTAELMGRDRCCSRAH